MILTTTSQFSDDNALSDYLASELRNARLALILGSGISADFRLPTWDALVDACCNSKGIPIPHVRGDNRDLAESVRMACANQNEYLDVQVFLGQITKGGTWKCCCKPTKLN